MINVTRSSMPDFGEYCEEIKELWDSHWLTNMGSKHKQLQAELEAFLGVPHIALYTNGHLALEGIWESLNLPRGGEVITTPFTFCSTVHAFVRKGLTPVFCDIDPDTYCMDAGKIEALITDKTVAICPVHVYGNICDVERIQKVADKHHLKVIYDAAHAFAVKYKGVSSALFGDLAMFSFHATKVFNTIEGGAVCFREDELVTKFNDLKNFGIHGPESTLYIGGNAKMNEFQAAMGICNLRHLDREIAKRKTVVERYKQNLAGVPGIRFCKPQKDVTPNYAYLPVVFDGYKKTRDEIFEELKQNGIIARKYFFPLVNDMECYKDFPTSGSEKTPVAKHVADRVLTLPMYADLSAEDVDRICKIILE
ncbi:MAG: DegT/DnrJ/EryC1/StrS family aminotransferase [Clostridia bacterium]|nr:DegT/DnrJ/EryC1/StrS family aminotransferase [Clostridia bacterium]